VRISGATAVDAAGKRCELAMRTDGGRIAYELPAAFLASAVYPLAVDPIISAEFGMGNPVHLPAAYNQMSPSVAWDGSHFLVVWQDWRNGSSSDIYGARVSSAGAVLDTLGIPVDSNPGYQQYLAVAAGSNGQSLVECQGWRYGAYRTVGVMIQDDPAVTVAATDPTAGESGTGQRTGTFRFTRTAPLTAALTVNFTVSGSATAGRDYTSIGTTVRFAVGSATATKTVSGINDSLVERDETVRVTLAGGTGYNVGSPSSATVTIKDDDT